MFVADSGISYGQNSGAFECHCQFLSFCGGYDLIGFWVSSKDLSKSEGDVQGGGESTEYLYPGWEPASITA